MRDDDAFRLLDDGLASLALLALIVVALLIPEPDSPAPKAKPQPVAENLRLELSHPLGPCDATMTVSIAGQKLQEECYRRKGKQ